MAPSRKLPEAPAEQLRAILTAIQAGELAAASSPERRLVHRLEGATTALLAIADSPEFLRLTHATPRGKLVDVDELVKVIGYIRVSTGEQTKSGLGLRAQESQIRSACEQHQWDLVELVADKGVSASSLDRPGLHRALERISHGEADGLVVSKLDRASRSVQDFAALLDWFDRSQATFIALDLGIDTSSPGGRLVANIFASVAQWERQVISARTKDGLAALRDKGRPTGAPSALDNPVLAARIGAMREAGSTYQSIADTLNAEGVPTVRGGELWRVSSVQAATGYRRPPTSPREPNLPPPRARRRRGKRP